jgi:periplasmic protein TonB
MFKNLVESGSQNRDFKRRSSYFFGTLTIYGLFIVSLGVISIYAYEVHLDEVYESEIVWVPKPISAQTQPTHRSASGPKGGDGNTSYKTPPQTNMASTLQPKMPDAVSSKPNPNVPSLFPSNSNETSYEPTGPGGNSPVGQPYGSPNDNGPGGNAGPNMFGNIDPPPPANVKPTPEPIQQPHPRMIAKQVINGEALTKEIPPYPHIAKVSRVSGPVKVKVVVDESGKVISATVISGHPLLLATAIKASYQWTFKPTMLDGKPVKVSGFITFNFHLN